MVFLCTAVAYLGLTFRDHSFDGWWPSQWRTKKRTPQRSLLSISLIRYASTVYMLCGLVWLNLPIAKLLKKTQYFFWIYYCWIFKEELLYRNTLLHECTCLIHCNFPRFLNSQIGILFKLYYLLCMIYWFHSRILPRFSNSQIGVLFKLYIFCV